MYVIKVIFAQVTVQFGLFELFGILSYYEVETFSFSDSFLTYSPLGIYFLFVIILTFVILYFSYAFVEQTPNVQKLSPYECGFEPFDSTKNQFDIKFFIIAILFIIFDIEVVLLLFWSMSVSKIELLSFWSVLEFLIEVGLALFYVWYLRVLEW